jgi:hypothetical protein
MTSHGFGFSTSGGNYANPFYASFLNPPGSTEFFSIPSNPAHTELSMPFCNHIECLGAPLTSGGRPGGAALGFLDQGPKPSFNI